MRTDITIRSTCREYECVPTAIYNAAACMEKSIDIDRIQNAMGGQVESREFRQLYSAVNAMFIEHDVIVIDGLKTIASLKKYLLKNYTCIILGAEQSDVAKRNKCGKLSIHAMNLVGVDHDLYHVINSYMGNDINTFVSEQQFNEKWIDGLLGEEIKLDIGKKRFTLPIAFMISGSKL
jgi:hypothetical protein